MTSSAASDTDSARKRTGLLGVGHQRGAAAQHFDPAAARQVHVEEDDLGPGRRDDRDRLVDVGGLADHLDAGPLGLADLGLDARTEHPVVVDEDDAHGRPAARRSVRGVAAAPGRPVPARRSRAGVPCPPPSVGSLMLVSALSISSSTSVPPSGTARSRAVPPLRSMRPMIDSLTPIRSSGTASRSKPGPRSRTDTKTVLPSTSAKTCTAPPSPPYLAAFTIASRAACIWAPSLLVERAVADDHDLDGDAVLVLHLGGVALRTASARVAGSSSSSLPVPSGL